MATLSDDKRRELLEDYLKIRIKGKPNVNTDIGLVPEERSLVNILDKVVQSGQFVDLAEFEKFRTLGTDRNEQYRMYDEMALDSIISAALELYADDATQYNTKGQVIWAESEDPTVARFANRLIEVLQLNENAWSYIYSLCKYGDLYLQLFRDDEIIEDPLVKNLDHTNIDTIRNKKGAVLEEYLERVPNPADIFDLYSYGKTVGFVHVNNYDNTDDNLAFRTYMYNTSDNNIQVYKPDKFVHIMIGADISRFPEKLSLTFDKDAQEQKRVDDINDVDYTQINPEGVREKESTIISCTYNVRRGKSILYDIYKIYREIQLMNDALLLNRVTRSSIIRLVQIEVGDMPQSQVEELMRRYKRMMEQKNYLNKDSGIFTSAATPGPIDNIIYIPTREGKGNITMSNLGGDVDVKSIADVDYFKKKLYGGLKIPPQFLGDTDDNAGFNGGTSLTKLDSRYARTIKRIQNAFIAGVTTLINIFAIDRKQLDYVNNFTVRMTSPATTEDSERDEMLSNRLNVVDNMLGVIPEDMIKPKTRKEILTFLISSYLSEPEVAASVEEDTLLDEMEEEELANADMESHGEGGGFSSGRDTNINIGGGGNDEPEYTGGDVTYADDTETDVGGAEEPEIDFGEVDI